MLQELEGNSNDLCDFNYETACSGDYDVLDFSSFHIQDEPFCITDGNQISETHFRKFKVLLHIFSLHPFKCKISI